MSEEIKSDNKEVEITEKDDNSSFCTFVFKGKFTAEYAETIFDAFRDMPKLPLVIYMCSDGGSIQVGAMLHDRLKALDIPVTFVSEMFNSSMGAMFPHIEDYVRLCYPHSVFVYHGARFNFTGSEKEIKLYEDYCYEVNDKWMTIFKESVGLTDEEAIHYNSYEHPLYGYKALGIGTKGMVDGVIVKDLRDGRFLCKTRGGLKVIDVRKHRRGDIAGLPVVEESQYK